jgi:hypothetical protein
LRAGWNGKLLENLMTALPRPLAHTAHAAQTCFQEEAEK